MLKGFYFFKEEVWEKEPKVSEILGILGSFIFQRKRGEVYRGTNLIFQNLFRVLRVSLKTLKSKKFPEVRNE